MMDYIRIMRPINVFMTFIGVLAGAIIAIGWDIISTHVLFFVLLAGTSASLITSAGNILNDVYDVEVDKINHPHRPIASGRLRIETCISYSFSLFIIGVLLSIFINIYCFILAIINSFLLYFYEKKVKKMGLPGNILISWLTGTIFLYGALSVLNINVVVLIFIALAFLASAGREVIKDMEDVKGDISRNTLPKKYGFKKAFYASSSFIILAVMLSPLPSWNVLNTSLSLSVYLPLIILADIIFIYTISISLKKPKMASKTSKVGMLVALISFIAGALVM